MTLFPSGQVTTIAGTGNAGFLDGLAQNTMFNSPWAICFSSLHNCLFISDYNNHRIRIFDLKTGMYWMHFIPFAKYSISGVVSSIGNGKKGFKDGPNAEFYFPQGLALVESDGSLLVADTFNQRIRKITLKGSFIVFYVCLFYIRLGSKPVVETIAESSSSNSTSGSLKCVMDYPHAIYMDNETNTCYFTTNSFVYKFFYHY